MFILKRPAEYLFDKLIEPMIEVLDTEYLGLWVLAVFFLEIILTLIVPWFFSWVIGLMCVLYLLIFFFILIFALHEDTNNKITVGLFLSYSLPYLVLLFLPTMAIAIFRKRPEKQLTLLETREIKLNKIKKKVKRNKLKFWKR